ncbi:WDR64-like protein [Mya arenaria]|uniref:WDR64-like protein n=1 Tax=Mya arenaria TaxID=6604 RepID=A0ABY7FID0_MYAAR|nr:WDR64-like protein [Mya arenaria]
MSGPETESSDRPYTVGSFQAKLNQFEELMKEITLQDVEATPEEKRQMITENLRYDQFCDAIRQLFGPDIKNHDLKALYRKISTNPDAKVDWSETSAEEAEEIMVGEEVSIFTVSKRRRIGPRQFREAAWVTGCDYLPSIRRASCCTERSIVIWDNRSKGKNQHVFAIKPFDNSPQCMVSVPKTGAIHEDRILFGDDQGYINILTVAAKDLTMKNSKGGEKKPAKDQNVLHVKYFPELHCFASCSPSSKTSFVLEEIDRIHDQQELRGVSIPKGVNTFDYCVKANIIATGGVDKVIRVWHPHIFSRPTVDICCNERDQHIISLSTARVFTDNEERPGEKRIYSMLFDNKHERLLTGSSLLLNKDLGQVVTVCTEAVLKVWEMESGKLVYTIPEAHKSSVEITALTLDSSGYRLASGAFDEKSGRASEEDLSIVGLLYSKLDDDRVLIAAGWNNKLKILLDTNENYDLPVIREFNDIYYYTQDVAFTSASPTPFDPFRGDPLPDIATENRSGSRHGSNAAASQKSGDEGTASRQPTTVRGLSNHQMSNLFKKLPEGDQPAINSRQQSRHGKEKRIHSIQILVHKTRRLDPAFLPKEPSFMESVKVPAEGEEAGAATNRSTSGTPESQDEERAKHEKDGSEKEDEEKDKKEDQEEHSEGGSDDEEKKDEEKSVHEEDEDPEVVRERHDAARYIVETYDPIIVTVHQDSYIRFWNTDGHVLREITAVTRRTGTAVTAVCADPDCNIMVTGDHKGYLTLWDIGKFLRNPESEEADLVKQVVCWRAHLTKVVVWWGRKGRFVGFFGQHRQFTFPTSEEKAGAPSLPYDITEGPLSPVKTKSAIQKIRPVQKWQPFKRSAYLKAGQDKKRTLDPQDKKFFEALIKPKAYNYHLEGVAPGRKRDGAVFRALPVYRVRTPERPKTPPMTLTFRSTADESDAPKPKDKQRGKGSKEGSSTSFSVRRRKSMFGKSSSVGRESMLSYTTAATTPMLPPIVAAPSSPRQ